jgi:predicted NACHT family NTPase
MSAEVATTALGKVADSLLKELVDSARGLAAKSMGKFQVEFGVGFEKYIKRNQNKCRFVKTLLHRIDPIPIEQAYVEPCLKIAQESVPGSSFPEKLNVLKNVVIVGGGGSGKSMFLKKLLLELCEYPLGRIPLFVELRDLNSRDEKELFKLIHHQWSELIPSFRIEALETGFRSGRFFLLLDGLDEVDRQERDKVSQGQL